MLVTILLTGAYWHIWLKVYLFANSNFAEYPFLDFTSMYYNFVVMSALLACFMTIVCSYHCQLTWQRTFAGSIPQPSVWQFSSRNFLYYSGCAAVMVGAAVGLYSSESRDILGLTLGDLCIIGMTMIMFMHLLQRSINWLSMGCCLILMGFLFLKSYEGTILEIVPLHERYIFWGSFLGFCTLTVWLYRWAGFRIVPRRELAMSKQPAEALSCTNY
jgi:hypothetical protein